MREGGQYISPKVQYLIDNRDEWPDTKNKMTRRRMECLIMLCNGCSIEQMCNMLNISPKTVDNHLNSLYFAYHVHNRIEMVALAYKLELMTSGDIHLYNKEKKRLPFPELAAVKRKRDRFYFD